MLITDYASLQSEIAEYLKRTDLTERIKTFIQLAEARIFTEPDLNVRDKEARIQADTIADEAFYGYPSGVRAVRHIKLFLDEGRKKNLIFMGPARFDDTFTDTSDPIRAREPIGWTIKGGEIILGPPPDKVYTMEFFVHKNFDKLSDSNTTNWIVTNQPNIYLYASLLEAEPYLVNDARTATWEALYTQSINKLILKDRRDRIPDGGGEMFTEISDVMLDYSRRGYLY